MGNIGSSRRRLKRSYPSTGILQQGNAKVPLSRRAALELFSQKGVQHIPKSKIRPSAIIHAFKVRPVAPPKAKLAPMSRAPRWLQKTAAGVAASMIAFTPMKARPMDSREPPPNPAYYPDTPNVQFLYKYQFGHEVKDFGFDCLRVSYRPKLFGLTNSGPVFTYENMFNRTSMDTIRIGVSQKISLSTNSLVKLGVFSPVLAQKLSLSDARVGVIFAHGPVTVDYFYRGLVSGQSAQGGGFSFNFGSGVIGGVGLGSKGYVDAGNTVRYGLKLTQVEGLLGLKKGSLLSPALDFGYTKVSGARDEVDIGVLLNPSKNFSFGVDVYDINSRGAGNKSNAKVAGILIIKF